MYQETNIIIIIISGTIILLLLAVLIIIFVVRNKNRDQQHKQQLLQTQLEIQEQTLKTISEEIHDNIGQILSLAKLNLNTFPANMPPEVATHMEATKKLVAKAINDLRDLSRSMRGDKIAELGLQEAVSNELKIIQNTGQFNTKLTVTGTAYKLAHQQQMVLFRMVQEALNNAIKHSKANIIHVTFQYRKDSFQLAIADDGVGFDTSERKPGPAGIGLKSMPNRAALVGAIFSVLSNPETGTCVNINLPIQQA